MARPHTTLELGLTIAYDLLVDALRMRNRSMFAHDFASVGYAGWRELGGKLGGFLGDVIDRHRRRHSSALPLAQLPSTLTELLP